MVKYVVGHKINKVTFIDILAKQHDMDRKDVERCYDIVINGIRDVVLKGNILSLYNFGSFYLQEHKGHKVQFSKSDEIMNDYLVFKFKTSKSLNQKIRNGGFELTNRVSKEKK